MSFMSGVNFGQDNYTPIRIEDSNQLLASFPVMQQNPQQAAFNLASQTRATGNGSYSNLPSIPNHLHTNEIIAESDEFEAIPEGWTKHWSNTYQRHYYFNAQTGEQNWKPAPSSATLEIRCEHAFSSHIFASAD
jgi:hypothetical protein